MGMSSGSDRETVMAVYDEWEAANARVAGLSLDALTHTDLLELQHLREVVVRSMPAVDHQIINRLAAETDPKALGGTNLADVLATKLRISKQEARRSRKPGGGSSRPSFWGRAKPSPVNRWRPRWRTPPPRRPKARSVWNMCASSSSSSTTCPATSTVRPAIRPRPTSPGWPRVWGQHSFARPRTGWRCYSTGWRATP